MEEYKSNSNRSKTEAKQEQLTERTPRAKAVVGGTRTKPKGEIRKFADAFVGDDLQHVKEYAKNEVFIPTVKEMIYNLIVACADTFIYHGEGRSRKRGTSDKVSYSGYYRSGRDDRRGDRFEPRGRSSSLDYDDIIFDRRGDAESVLDAMDALLEKYGMVSIADLYDLADVTTTNYQTSKYGWTNLREAKVVHVRDGYAIKLPRAVPLN